MKNKKVLLIGGTRYFGKILAEKLIAADTDLTILSRNPLPESLKGSTHCQGDRLDSELLGSLFSHHKFDLIYDQYCMNADHAKLIAKYLLKSNSTYIMTSTMSVYDTAADIKESFFDTAKYNYNSVANEKTDYQNAKRQAEYEILNSGFKNFTFIRIPIVLGIGDYTLRLHQHIEHGLKSIPLFFPNLNAKMSFVESHTVADVMIQLGHAGKSVGALNVASPDAISMQNLLEWISRETEKPFQLIDANEFESLNDSLKAKYQSPFATNEDWYLSVAKLKSLGIQLPQLDLWLPKLIKDLKQQLAP